MKQETNCACITEVQQETQVVLRKVVIGRGGREYVIPVTTQEHFEAAIRHLLQSEDETYPLVLEDISDPKMVCAALNQIPEENLTPFLIDSAS